MKTYVHKDIGTLAIVWLKAARLQYDFPLVAQVLAVFPFLANLRIPSVLAEVAKTVSGYRAMLICLDYVWVYRYVWAYGYAYVSV